MSIVGGGTLGEEAFPIILGQNRFESRPGVGQRFPRDADRAPFEMAEESGRAPHVLILHLQTKGQSGEPGMDLAVEEEQTVDDRRQLILRFIDAAGFDEAPDRSSA